MPRFRNLTKAQEEAFERIACNLPAQCAQRTIDALKAKGLVEEYEECIGADALGAILVSAYEVPLGVHAEWCGWCAEQLDTSDLTPF